jgi:hypothetical protein
MVLALFCFSGGATLPIAVGDSFGRAFPCFQKLLLHLRPRLLNRF